jgi:hypothetical protein
MEFDQIHCFIEWPDKPRPTAPQSEWDEWLRHLVGIYIEQVACADSADRVVAVVDSLMRELECLPASTVKRAVVEMNLQTDLADSERWGIN